MELSERTINSLAKHSDEKLEMMARECVDSYRAATGNLKWQLRGEAEIYNAELNRRALVK